METAFSKVSTGAALLCLVAMAILATAENYSGPEAPGETLELYDTLKSVIVWTLLASILMPLVVSFGRGFWRWSVRLRT
jgi:hypothetical protein